MRTGNIVGDFRDKGVSFIEGLHVTDELVSVSCSTATSMRRAYESGDFELLALEWRIEFYIACRWCGITDPGSCDALFYGLAQGNWEHLHMSRDEEVVGAVGWAEALVDDASYCCDRWSIDRITRCHWCFRNMLMRIESEGVGK